MTRDKRWRRDVGIWILLGLFILQFLFSFRPTNLAWDGVYYYAYARSIVFDGDLHLENDLELAYDVTPAYDFAGAGFEDVRTSTGRVDSPFAIGTGLLWLPWFALVYGLARLAALLGIGPASLTGFEWPFVWGMAAVTAVYGWVTVVVGYRLIRRWIARRAALFAAAVLTFVTPLWYYGFQEPFYAHTTSAMTVSLFVAAWWRTVETDDRRISAALHLGALAGLAALVRWQNLAYLILPLLTALGIGSSAWRERDRQRLLAAARSLLLTLIATLILFGPQLAVWTRFYGRPWALPQGQNFLSAWPRWLPQVLLSPFHGLIPWMPVTAFALVGLVLLSRRRPQLAWPLLAAFLLQTLVNSCVRDWFGGGGYGARRFSNTFIILLVGYATLLSRRMPGWVRLGTALSGGLLVLHQWLIIRYGFAAQIGGHVIEMAPSYTWSNDSLATFARQLVSYVSLLIHHPIQSMILPASPLTGPPLAAARQLLLLVAALGALVALRWCGQRLGRGISSRLITPGLAILIVGVDVWLLTCA